MRFHSISRFFEESLVKRIVLTNRFVDFVNKSFLQPVCSHEKSSPVLPLLKSGKRFAILFHLAFFSRCVSYFDSRHFLSPGRSRPPAPTGPGAQNRYVNFCPKMPSAIEASRNQLFSTFCGFLLREPVVFNVFSSCCTRFARKCRIAPKCVIYSPSMPHPNFL